MTGFVTVSLRHSVTSSVNDRQDVILGHDEDILAVEFDLGAGVGTEDDLVALLDRERDALAGVGVEGLLEPQATMVSTSTPRPATFSMRPSCERLDSASVYRGGGTAASAAILIRPNLAPLAALIAGWKLFYAIRDRQHPRWVLTFVTGVIPGCLIVAMVKVPLGLVPDSLPAE